MSILAFKIKKLVCSISLCIHISFLPTICAFWSHLSVWYIGIVHADLADVYTKKGIMRLIPHVWINDMIILVHYEVHTSMYIWSDFMFWPPLDVCVLANAVKL